MKFNINKNILVENLQKVLGPTTTKQNFPILNSIRIDAKDNKLKITATDLDITIISFQEVTILEEGVCVIPMKRFFSIIRELPSCDILVESRKNNLLISCEKIEFKMSKLNEDDFPKIEEEKKATLIKIMPESLEEMIRLTSFSVGREEENYVLGGIFFEVKEDKIKLVSTDGKRLSFIERFLAPNQTEVKEPVSFILPLKAVNELYKLVKEREDIVYLFIDENKVGFDFKDTQFIARPIEGEFPKYSQYIPQEESLNKLEINRQKMLSSLRRAELLSTKDHQGIKMSLKKNNIVISKATPHLGEVEEQIDTPYSGAALELGVNSQFLIDVLRNLTEEDIVLEFFAVDKPIVLRKDKYVSLIVPMKL